MTDMDRLARYLSVQFGHKRAGRTNQRAGTACRPVITISRERGARGTAIARVLVDTLQARSGDAAQPWALFDRNLAATIVEQHGLPERMAKSLPESAHGGLAAQVQELLGLHPGRATLAVDTAATIRRLADIGNVVIVGRGANLVTADRVGAIAVRVIGSMAARTRFVMENDDLDEASATAHIRKTDRDRRSYVRRFFSSDVADPLTYDLTINTDRLTNAQVVEVVIGLLPK